MCVLACHVNSSNSDRVRNTQEMMQYSREMVAGGWRGAGGGRRRGVHGGRRAGVAGASRRGASGGRACRRRYRGGLVVLCGKGSLVQHVLGVVCLRGGLDVHERDGCANPAAGDGARNRTRALRSTQQFDILDSAIAATTIK